MFLRNHRLKQADDSIHNESRLRDRSDSYVTFRTNLMQTSWSNAVDRNLL